MNFIKKNGVVVEIKESRLVVLIEKNSLCNECHSKDVCGELGCSHQKLEVKTDRIEKYHLGQRVLVSVLEKNAWLAIGLAYIMPLVQLGTVFVTVNMLVENEVVAGGLAILSLIPYYAVLFMCNKILERKIAVEIE